ncbi:MAG: PAS domain-containing protein [Candidatus Marinamargulisbacteria bacterium]|nr:PAS domain-containing protein [Candidatus Marinamargulisbacteria bacterium]
MTVSIRWILYVLALMGLSAIPHVYTIQQQGAYSVQQWVAISCAGVAIAILGAAGYYYERKTMRIINDACHKAMAERRLANLFPDFYRKLTHKNLLENLQTIFSMFKSLDHLKSARVSLEVKTVKLLSNSIQEGVVLVNKDKVVSYINAQAEQALRLIPGEVTGETIIRHIHNADIIKALDLALESEEKTTDLIIECVDGLFWVTVLPIHDRFGSVSRALFIMKQKLEESI